MLDLKLLQLFNGDFFLACKQSSYKLFVNVKSVMLYFPIVHVSKLGHITIFMQCLWVNYRIGESLTETAILFSRMLVYTTQNERGCETDMCKKDEEKTDCIRETAKNLFLFLADTLTTEPRRGGG